jgi:thioesterase domain-containing protein
VTFSPIRRYRNLQRRSATSQSLNATLICSPSEHGNLRPLFLIHPAGGSAGYAQALAPWLDTDLPVYGLVAKGLVAGETPLKTIEEMAALYIQEMRRVQPQGPYRVAGWSAGGTIAYEIANQLVGADESIEFLGLIDAGNQPADPKKAAELDEAAILRVHLEDEVPPGPQRDELMTLVASNDIDSVFALCQAENLIPQDIDKDNLRRHLAVLQATAQANFSYSAPQLSVPVFLFTATDEDRSDGTLGWGSLLGDRIQLTPIGGTHRTIVEPPHVEALGKAISRKLADASAKVAPHPEHSYSPSITLQRGRPDTPPLFCVPGAGASITTFYDLVQALDPTTQIYGLQPRGRDGVLVPHVDVPSAARAYVRAIREIFPCGPYQLLGHSFGGWVVFEMARQLIASGEQVARLVVLDAEAPSTEEGQRKRYSRVEMLMELVKVFELKLRRSMSLTAVDFAALDHTQQLKLLLRRSIEMKLLPPRTSIEVLGGIVRLFETNLNTDYVPRGTYSGPLHLVGVSDSERESDHSDKQADLVTLWRQHAPECTLWVGPGNHMTLLDPPHVTRLAAWLSALLKDDQCKIAEAAQVTVG